MLPSICTSQKRKSAEDRPFHVIELKLFPPTSRHYPRFDYEEILKELGLDEHKGEEKLVEKNDFRDHDAEEIVRRLEAKYGTQTVSMQASSSKKSKKSKKSLKFVPEDIMDKGLGYDREDEFIDDDQAYDEWVPTTMDTAKRGHYVNKGPLEFRQIDVDATTTSSTSDDEESNVSAGVVSLLGEEDEEDLMEIEVLEKNPETGKSGTKNGADSKNDGKHPVLEKPKCNDDIIVLDNDDDGKSNPTKNTIGEEPRR